MMLAQCTKSNRAVQNCETTEIECINAADSDSPACQCSQAHVACLEALSIGCSSTDAVYADAQTHVNLYCSTSLLPSLKIASYTCVGLLIIVYIFYHRCRNRNHVSQASEVSSDPSMAAASTAWATSSSTDAVDVVAQTGVNFHCSTLATGSTDQDDMLDMSTRPEPSAPPMALMMEPGTATNTYYSSPTSHSRPRSSSPANNSWTNPPPP